MRFRKYAQVVEGARRVFLRDGFDRASMDEVAREAGVSKATLYAYFPDKRIMFAEVFREELRSPTVIETMSVSSDLPPEEALPRFCEALTRYLVSRTHVNVVRLSVGEAGRFPILAREYYDAWPMRRRATLVGYLRLCVERGHLAIDDFELAAEQLVRLSGALVHDRAVLLGEECDDAAIHRSVSGAVTMFLSHYAPAGSRAGRNDSADERIVKDAPPPG